MEPVAEDVVESSPWSPFEAAYRRNLSVERLRRYRSDRDRGSWTPAIGRYLFNVEVARALVPALHWAEVCLRNHLDAVIGAAYPVDAGAGRGFRRVACWLDADPPVLLEKEQARVREAMESFDRKNPPPRRGGRPAKALTPSRLLAELGLGFWTHLLDGAYENWRAPGGRRFWPALLGRAFPHCPRREKTRGAIHARFVEVKEIRNRTFHHERIAHQVSLELYDRALEAVSWIDPVIAAGVRERDRPRLAELLAHGPAPFIAWAAGHASGSREGADSGRSLDRDAGESPAAVRVFRLAEEGAGPGIDTG